jgi:hypothetical protein
MNLEQGLAGLVVQIAVNFGVVEITRFILAQLRAMVPGDEGSRAGDS